jgi:hypothetical protein
MPWPTVVHLVESPILCLCSPKLRILNVAFCHNLSEGKIISCLQQCGLRTLNVTHCRGVSLQVCEDVVYVRLGGKGQWRVFPSACASNGSTVACEQWM